MKSGSSKDIENLARYLSQPFGEHFLDEKHKEHAAKALQRWPLLAKISKSRDEHPDGSPPTIETTAA